MADPATLIDLILGYRRAKVLMVGAYHRVFQAMERPATAAAVARRRRLDTRATEILLDALAAMGLVRKHAGRYTNSALSRRFLVDSSPQSLSDNLRFQELIWDAWGDLRAIVKAGRPPRALDYWLMRHPGFAQEYIRGMDNIAKRPAREIADLVDLSQARRMLDVGAGPGTFSLTLLDRYPKLRATLLDLPVTLQITRQFLARSPRLRTRARLQAGDYHRAPFGHREHDLVLMSHITHDESPERNAKLVRKAYRALRRGGRLLIHDFTVREDRAGPAFGALFSVHMLAFTKSGRTYTASEYKGWMRAGGFTGIIERVICASSRNPSRLFIGVKP